MKAFGINVTAGVVSGLLFAIILMIAAAIWTRDPSPIQLEKRILHGLERPSPAGPAVSPPAGSSRD